MKKLKQYRNDFLFLCGVFMIIGGFLAAYVALRQERFAITEDTSQSQLSQ